MARHARQEKAPKTTAVSADAAFPSRQKGNVISRGSRTLCAIAVRIYEGSTTTRTISLAGYGT